MADRKQRVQLTPDELKLLQTIVLNEVCKRINTNQPLLTAATLLAKLGRARNKCAIM